MVKNKRQIKLAKRKRDLKLKDQRVQRHLELVAKKHQQDLKILELIKDIKDTVKKGQIVRKVKSGLL